MYRWIGPSQQRPRNFFDAQQTVFSTTSCKISPRRNVRRRHTLQRRPRATLLALAQCQDRRLFHLNPNLKKHLPISIRWLLSETECCKRCECTAPEDIRHAERPGRGIYTGEIHLAVSCGAVGPRCTAIQCFNMVRLRVWFGRKGWRGCTVVKSSTGILSNG